MKPRTNFPLIFTVLTILAVAMACASSQKVGGLPVESEPPPAAPTADDAEGSTATPSATASPAPEPTRTAKPTPTVSQPLERGDVPQAVFDSIVADLMEATGAAAGEISVVRAESVVWSDGSLGCPRPGVAYTQALVDGYWAILVHQEKEYDYRTNDRGSFILCSQPNSGEGLPGRPVPGNPLK